VVNDPGRPLAAKLGVKEGSTLAVLDGPVDLVLDTPPGVVVRRTARGQADVVLAFFTRASKIEPLLARLGSMIFPSGGLWIAWPKKSSGVDTDITDDVVRDIVLRGQLVDNKVCAIDGTWTALRFVWRRQHRGAVGPG
jgi:hypothetical protein